MSQKKNDTLIVKNWTKIVSSVTNTSTAQFFSGTPCIERNLFSINFIPMGGGGGYVFFLCDLKPKK